MIHNFDTEVAEIGVRFLDDAYLAWFAAEGECEGALHAWFRSAGAQRTSAYVAYRAALDREEAAAGTWRGYGRCPRRAARRSSTAARACTDHEPNSDSTPGHRLVRPPPPRRNLPRLPAPPARRVAGRLMEASEAPMYHTGPAIALPSSRAMPIGSRS